MVSGRAGPISKTDKRLSCSIRLNKDGNNRVCWVRNVGDPADDKFAPAVPEATLFNSQSSLSWCDLQFNGGESKT